jgi:hypothetical protein
MVARQTRARPSFNGGRLSDPAEMIAEHPATSMVVLFGVGLGVGLVVGHAICESMRTERSDSLLNKLSCQIRDTLKQALPEGVWQHLS